MDVFHWLYFDLFDIIKARSVHKCIIAQLSNDALVDQIFWLSASMTSELAGIIFRGTDYSNCFSEADCCLVLVG